ncbi:hypothetical protein [Roseospirillum parvum]|uniref:Antitoxin SocA-like Panacea domain-containing protein n=1 Tax=Roseospirillum parvum TaxID=83401 RepID=A0A1G7ZDU7_9PROT|nr:hypothetical protein [Roseospirillum parvum]SDH06270.1 hypothetical protein SAMN05421742_10466 [Roseospirillum parvum]
MSGSTKKALKNRTKAVAIVRCAGGRLVGRTRLQKTAYLMELAGYGEGFDFEYRHYGPYSEDLSQAMELAEAFEMVKEEEKPTEWGGWYSIYTVEGETETETETGKTKFVRTVSQYNAIELELAATAAYLKKEEGIADPWEETRRRKPEKATPERLQGAKRIYQEIRRLPAPVPLPEIA